MFSGLMLGIGCGSPMKESNLWMTSRHPVTSDTTARARNHNSSPLNTLTEDPAFMILQAVSRTSTAHALLAEGRVHKSERVPTSYEKHLLLKYLGLF